MEKIIKIGKQEVRLNNNISWAMVYRDQFGKDIIPSLMPLLQTISEGVASVLSDIGKSESITVVDIANALQGRSMDILLPLYQIEFVDLINITWSMAKVADENILPPTQWIKQFDSFPVDVVLPTVYDMILKGSFSSKNLRRLKNAGQNLKNLQPSLSTISSSPDLNED